MARQQHMQPYSQPQPQLQHKRAGGFTLIEIMVVVALVGILATIAYPSYLEHLRKGRRAEARTALMDGAQWLERLATSRGNYLTSAEARNFPASLTRVDSGGYTIAISNLNADGLTFTLTATRSPGSAQATDRCGDFTLTHAGQRGVINQASGVAAEDCWR